MKNYDLHLTFNETVLSNEECEQLFHLLNRGLTLRNILILGMRKAKNQKSKGGKK